MKIWDLASGGHHINTLECHASRVNSVAVTPDSTKIVSGSGDKTVRVWDLKNGSNIFVCKFDSTIMTIAIAIAISKDKNMMTIGNFNGGIYTINIV